MSRLPQPGADENIWGSILNDFLSTSHDPDGSLKPSAIVPPDGSITAAKLADNSISATQLAPGTITATQLDTPTQTSLDLADSALQVAPVTSVAGKTGAVVLAQGDVGLTNVDNTSDTDKPVSITQQTALNLKVDTSDSRLTDARTPLAHTQVASTISDSTVTGRSVLTATDATTARAAIGAGTSSLSIGTTAGTAAAGDDARIVGAATADSVTAEAATARANEANASFLTTGTVDDARLPVSAQAATLTATYLASADGVAFTWNGNPATLGSEGAPAYESNLRRWFAALAARDDAPATILALGDSITEGTGATNIGHRWQQVLQRRLRSIMQPAGVTGAVVPYLPAKWYGTMPMTPYTVVAGTVGADTNFGLGGRSLTLNDATSSVTYAFTGTHAKVLHGQGGAAGVINAVVDGGAAVTLNTYNATAAGGLTLDLGALAPGAHTVVLTRDVTTTGTRKCYIEGLLVSDGDEAAGIRVLDAGHYGLALSAMLTSTYTMASIQAVAPSLIIAPLGSNDINAGRTAAQFKTDIEALITKLRLAAATGGYFTGSILLPFLYMRTGMSAVTWAAYGVAMSEIATADPNVAFLDLRSRMPDAGAAEDLGLFADSAHPSDKGHAFIADVIAAAITPR